jgi:hypothetical protein
VLSPTGTGERTVIRRLLLLALLAGAMTLGSHATPVADGSEPATGLFDPYAELDTSQAIIVPHTPGSWIELICADAAGTDCHNEYHES